MAKVILQEWLKFLNVCGDIVFNYQCLSNKIEQELKNVDHWFIRSQKWYTYFSAFETISIKVTKKHYSGHIVNMSL